MATARPTLHHLDRSQSMKILWLLEELGIDYDLKLYERHTSGPKEARAPDELEQIHPLGKSPQLVTADGRVIIESVAIANYLIQTYDTKKQFQGDPATGNDQIRDDILTNFGSASLSPITVIETLFDVMAKKAPFGFKWLMGSIRSKIQQVFTTVEFEKSWKFLESELGEQDYFMGTRPGRADFILSWSFDYCTQRKYVHLKKYPNLDRWYARCQAREGWKRARSKGNDYDLSSP